MKTFPAILVITVVLASVSGSEQYMSTYISNWSTRQIRATMIYQSTGYEQHVFEDCLIDPYTWQVGDYTKLVFSIDVEIWIEGSPHHILFRLSPDRSIVAFDNGPAINIYLVEYGKLIVIDSGATEPLATMNP